MDNNNNSIIKRISPEDMAASWLRLSRKTNSQPIPPKTQEDIANGWLRLCRIACPLPQGIMNNLVLIEWQQGVLYRQLPELLILGFEDKPAIEQYLLLARHFNQFLNIETGRNYQLHEGTSSAGLSSLGHAAKDKALLPPEYQDKNIAFGAFPVIRIHEPKDPPVYGYELRPEYGWRIFYEQSLLNSDKNTVALYEFYLESELSKYEPVSAHGNDSFRNVAAKRALHIKPAWEDFLKSYLTSKAKSMTAL